MTRDYLGNPIASGRPETRRAIDDFIAGALSYHPRMEAIVPAAEADPDDGLANAYAGFLMMFLEAPEAPARAARYLDRAAAAVGGADERGQAHVRLLRAWMDDDVPLALALADQLVDAHPRDLFMAKFHQYLEFNRGGFAGMLRMGLKAVSGAPDVAYAHGMLAFGYEQCHLLDEAGQAAREALARQRDEPWAQHALAHVMLTQGRVAEGVRMLESYRDTWPGLNSFMYTHLWWHLALFYLARGRDQDALALYDRHVWGVCPEYSQDQVGAVSLLARLEMAGADVGSRWQALADYLKARHSDAVQPFLSLQYLYGLARAGRPEAGRLLAALRQRADSAPAHSRQAWRGVTLPAAEGLAAHAAGDFERAAERLGEALPRLSAIGGSHAQRDLFTLIQEDAVLRAGHWGAAQQNLELRRRYDAMDVPANRALARVYQALDLPGPAAKAAARAEQGLAEGEAQARLTSPA